MEYLPVERAVTYAAAAVSAAVGATSAGGFDPVIGGLIGTIVVTGGTVAVALIGRSNRATPSSPPTPLPASDSDDDDDRLSVPREDWEALIRESAQWRAHQREQDELRHLRDDR